MAVKGKYRFIEKEYIAQRLVGRLNIDAQNCAIGSKQADDDLIDRVIRQKEAMVETYLNMIYLTPLKLENEFTVNILAEIVENLVVAVLLPIYYTGGSVPQTGVEPSSLAGASAQSAQEMLWIYITGHNMYLPGVNSSPTSPRGGPIPQPVVLPGECLRGGKDRLDTIVHHETYVGNFSKYKTPDNNLFNFNCF